MLLMIMVLTARDILKRMKNKAKKGRLLIIYVAQVVGLFVPSVQLLSQ